MYEDRRDVRDVEIKIRLSSKHAALLEVMSMRDGKQRATWIHDLVVWHLFSSLNPNESEYDKRFD